MLVRRLAVEDLQSTIPVRLTSIAASKKAKRPIKSRQSLAEKQAGTTLFPMARVKKLIKADRDLENMSSEATFMIAVATVRLHSWPYCTTEGAQALIKQEYFVQHFMEEGYTRARLDNRKLVTYKDMGT